LIVFLSVSSLMASNKDSYLNKADRELQSVSAKVNALQRRAERAGASTREELDRRLKTVQEKLDVARRKLTEIQGSSEESWKSLRRGADETLRDVKSAYEKATSIFNKQKTRKTSHE